jgi:alkylation response protein AidB-like acyl-CoA dehydrogenase
MNFDLNEDQALLKATAEKLFSVPGDNHAPLWTRMAEAGFLAAPFDEAHGGMGLGPVEMMVLAEAAGGAQAVTPYVSSIIMAGSALRMAPEPDGDLIGAVAEARASLAWAHDEKGLAAGADRQTTATAVAGGWQLTGKKIHVAGLAGDGHMVVTAQSGGSPMIFKLPAETGGISTLHYRLFDGSSVSEVSFTDAHVPADGRVASGDAAAVLITRAREYAAAWLAGEAVGLMQTVLDATLDHLRTRKQFDMPLSSLQSLRHLAVDMLVALEQARSMAMFAALSVDENDNLARAAAISQVRSVVAKSCRLVGQTAVQLHGGIGVTEEHPVGRAFRRLTMIDLEMSRA